MGMLGVEVVACWCWQCGGSCIGADGGSSDDGVNGGGDGDNGCGGGSDGGGHSADDHRGNDNITFCRSIGVGYDLRMRHNDICSSPYKGPQ